MLDLLKCEFLEKLLEDSEESIYRVLNKENNKTIIVKVYKDESSFQEQFGKIKNEYEVLRALNIPSVIKAYSVEKYKQNPAIILEDFKGEILKKVIEKAAIDLENFLIISIKLTGILKELNENHIIHKNINSKNIIINLETKEVKLTGFERASFAFKDHQEVVISKESLGYMAPEQTGRMNRTVDYRSDFYSLGVVFYEMLTGGLPFQSDDSLELMHCHIARKPKAPHDIDKNIPKMVSSVVMKLLSKNVEDRYNNAGSIKLDLEECLNQWRKNGNIKRFQLARKEYVDRLIISPSIYGRESELQELLTTLQEVSNGAKRMVMVSGEAGVGKSTLINELQKSTTAENGYFICGKFEQFNRSKPYECIIDTIRDLIHQILMESEENIKVWKKDIAKALGDYGQVILEFIPELEYIIGKQSLTLGREGIETEDLFTIVFKEFINVFARINRPLIIFYDDLHWADQASLKLIKELACDCKNEYLLIIGTLRDNEGVNNPFVGKTLKEINEVGQDIKYINLKPLRLENIRNLLAHSLLCEEERCLKLADILMKKTNGNPLFLKQFLKSLCEEKILFYDDKTKSWKYDINSIKAMQITDNVVDLVITRIRKLSFNAQYLLTLAAYLGNKFNLKTLALINESSEVITAIELSEAVKEGLIVPIKNNPIVLSRENNFLINDNGNLSYRFVHDRIQQAAYDLVEEENKEEFHYKVGKSLLENVNLQDDGEHIFQIVNHLNLAKELIIEEERDKIAELNLIAGKKASGLAAYRLALEYFNTGIELLPKDKWKHQHDLIFQLYKESAEHECVNGNYKSGEDKLNYLLKYSKGKIEKAKVYQVLINYNAYISENKKAAECALECLKMFGISIKINTTKADIVDKVKKLRDELGERKIGELANLPIMQDEEKKVAMDVLASSISVIGYLNEQNSKNLLAAALCEMVSISLEYGNTISSAEGYICFCLVLTNQFGRRREAYELGKVSYALVNKFKLNNYYKAKVCHYFGCNIAYLKSSLFSGIEYLMEAEAAASQSGSLAIINYTRLQIVTIYLICGFNLIELVEICDKYIENARKIKGNDIDEVILVIKRLVLTLTGKVNEGHAYEIGIKDEYLKVIENFKEPVAKLVYYTITMQVCYLLGKYEEALENGRKAEELLWSAVASKYLSVYYFYNSLTLAVMYNKASQEDKKLYMKKIKGNQKQLKTWVENSPHSFKHQYLIIEGQVAALTRDGHKAIKLFEEALKDAKKNGFIQDVAICSELIGELLIDKGIETAAKMYIDTACSYYEKWGAFEKIKQLHNKYSEFLSNKPQEETDVKELIAITTESTSHNMDMNAVIKASQAISGEIIFNELIEKILKIAVENAGAQKGYFIIEEEENLVINAEWEIDSEEAMVGKNIPLQESKEISQGIVYYAARTKQNIVLDDAANEGIFISDSYVIRREPKSIMCIPIINVGKLKGILYLENNLTTKAFTHERVEILKIFASQAAISIENASMYNRIKRLNEDLEVQVEKRTRELKETVEKLKLEIAERKEIENAFRENEERLNTLINSMPDVVGFKDGEGKWLELNQATVDLLELNREDYIGRTFLDMSKEFPKYRDVFSTCNATEEKAWENGTIYQEEEIIPKSDGTPRTFDVMKVPLFYPDGKRKGMVLIARDITNRKKAEDKLRESEERYRCLIDLIPDSIRVSIEGKIVLTNKATNKDFAVENADDIVGKHIFDFLTPHSDYAEKYKMIEEAAYKNGKMPPTEEKFIRKSDGAILERETVIRKIPYDGKEAFLVVARDISARKRVEELHKRMEESDRRLKETVEYDKIKTEFFANISHELRTPLNVILGTIQVSNLLLGDEIGDFGIKDKEKFKKYMHIMKQNCYRLVRLVNNLIDITKIDAGYLQMNWKNCDIVNIVEEIALSIAEYIENKGIELIFDTDIEEKIMACDPDKIERIILNLISNAVKFTEPGGNIQVTIFDKNDHIIISVKDTGMGIPKGKQKQIFERFVQVDKSLARVSEGSGIGLSLVKSLVGMHGGKIELISEVGKGSEFLVALPSKVLVEEKRSIEDSRLQQGNIEKIQIEFSDVYL